MLSQRKEDVRAVLVLFKYLEDSSVKGEIGSRGQQKITCFGAKEVWV